MKEKIFVTKSILPPLEDYMAEIKDLWDSHMLTNMGPKHEKLQEKLKDYLNVSQLELFVNGHNAIEFALQSLEKKGEVITTAFTFISTTHAIVRSGCTPVFCDIHPETLTMDVNLIESLITEKTVAILPVHVYGMACDVYALEKLGEKYQLPIIYDAAHCFAVEVDGRGIGSFGDLSCYSFHATKIFHTIEGGAIAINQPKYQENIRAKRNFGIEDGEIVTVGGNGKMNEFSAAMGLCNLNAMGQVIEAREKVYRTYVERLGKTGLKFLPEQENVKRNYAYCPIFIDPVLCGFTRDQLYDALMAENIFTRRYFYPITSEAPCYKGKYKGESPIAQKVSESVLCLPLYPDLEAEVLATVCDLIHHLGGKS